MEAHIVFDNRVLTPKRKGEEYVCLHNRPTLPNSFNLWLIQCIDTAKSTKIDDDDTQCHVGVKFCIRHIKK